MPGATVLLHTSCEQENAIISEASEHKQRKRASEVPSRRVQLRHMAFREDASVSSGSSSSSSEEERKREQISRPLRFSDGSNTRAVLYAHKRAGWVCWLPPSPPTYLGTELVDARFSLFGGNLSLDPAPDRGLSQDHQLPHHQEGNATVAPAGYRLTQTRNNNERADDYFCIILNAETMCSTNYSSRQEEGVRTQRSQRATSIYFKAGRHKKTKKKQTVGPTITEGN